MIDLLDWNSASLVSIHISLSAKEWVFESQLSEDVHDTMKFMNVLFYSFQMLLVLMQTQRGIVRV